MRRFQTPVQKTNKPSWLLITLLVLWITLFTAGQCLARGFGTGSLRLVERHIYDKAFEAQKEQERQRQKQLEEARREAEYTGYISKERREISNQGSLKHPDSQTIQ